MPTSLPIFDVEQFRPLDPNLAQFEETMRQLRASYPDDYGYSEQWRLEWYGRRYGRDAVPAEFRDQLPVRHTCRQCGSMGVIAPTDDGMFRRRANGRPYNQCRRCEREAEEARRQTRTAERIFAERGRRFGVELEVNCRMRGGHYGEPAISDADLARRLRDAGIACQAEGYTHRVIANAWKIVPDSSVQGWEVVSPPLTWDQRDQIRTVCEVLSRAGCTVGHETGLHVHHEVRDLGLDGIKKLVRRWHEVQPVTNRLTSADRVGGQWSAEYSPYTVQNVERFRSLRDLQHTERYMSLNLSCFNQYGTVEVRQHEGCLDADKIISWIAYGRAIIDAAKTDQALMLPNPPSAPECNGILDSLPFQCEDSRKKCKEVVTGPAYYTGSYDDDDDDDSYDDGDAVEVGWNGQW